MATFTEALRNKAPTEFITKELTTISASMADVQQKIENLEKEKLKLPALNPTTVIAAEGSYLGSWLFLLVTKFRVNLIIYLISTTPLFFSSFSRDL